MSWTVFYYLQTRHQVSLSRKNSRFSIKSYFNIASKEFYAIEADERILVTSGNSFVSFNIVDLLLSLGYIVRGTVRSEKPWLNQVFDTKYGARKFQSVTVSTLDDKGALAAVLDGVSGVFHVVSITLSE